MASWFYLLYKTNDLKAFRFYPEYYLKKNAQRLIILCVLILTPFVFVNYIFEDELGNFDKREVNYNGYSHYTTGDHLYTYGLDRYPFNAKVNIEALDFYSYWSVRSRLFDLSEFYKETYNNDDAHKDFAIEMSFIAFARSGLGVFEGYDISEVEDKTTALYYVAKGLSLEQEKDYSNAEGFFIKALENSDFTPLVMSYLKSMWMSVGDYEHFKSLAYHPVVFKYLPFNFKRDIFKQDGAYGWYSYNILYHDYLSADALGYLGVIFGILVWLFFLFKLLFITRKKWKIIIGLFIFSSLFTGFVYPISEFFWWLLPSLGFHWTKVDFGYNFLVIGVVEEVVKMIPWLLTYFLFKKHFKRPVHFIMLPIVSALAFAFSENLIYINSQDYNLLFVRSTMCIAVHVACSATIGYMLFLSKTKRIQLHWTLSILIGIFIAASLHGAYDYYIHISRGLVSIIFYFLSIHIFILMMNNVINVSNVVHKNSNTIIKQNGFTFLIGLFVVFLSMYFIIGIEFGYSTANYLLSTNILIVLFSSIYLFFMFSRISIQPGVVNKFTFNYLVGQFFSGGSKISSEVNYINKKYKLFTAKSNLYIGNQLPVVITIVEYVTVQDDNEWVLVKFEKEISVDTCHKTYALLRVKNKEQELFMDKVEVMLLMIPNYSEFCMSDIHHSSDFYYTGKIYSRPL